MGWRQLRRALGDLIFPANCIACGTLPRQSDGLMCKPCNETCIPLSTGCTVCASPEVHQAALCYRCRDHLPSFAGTYAAYAYGGELQQLIRRFKYSRATQLARPLVDLAWSVLQASHAFSTYRRAHSADHNIVVPVPLHRRRLRKRGFNQSILLAKWIAKRLRWPLRVTMVKRVRDTPAQISLSPTQRRNNVAGAFFAKKNGDRNTNLAGRRRHDYRGNSGCMRKCASESRCHQRQCLDGRPSRPIVSNAMAGKKKKGAKKAATDGRKLIARNKQARRNYEISDRYEAGLVLTGSEVKSMRNGDANINDSYVEIRKGEAYLVNCHVAPYTQATYLNHEPRRVRKLLLHHDEIRRLAIKLSERGLALVPLELYFRRGRVKVELGLGKGKKLHDKRHTLRDRDIKRDLARERSDH